MRRRMINVMVELTGYGSLRHVAVSLPYVAELVDGVKYLEPADVKPKESRDLRRIRQVKASRAPTLRSLVRLAVRCDSAEQLGLELRRRYQRRRVESDRADAEIDAQLDRLLAQD